MYRERSVGVVVPVYNEERFIGTVLETVPGFVDRVYVVDDRSTDDTWTRIRAHVAERRTGSVHGSGARDGEAGTGPHVVPIRHERNRGRGGAVKTGYRTALSDGLDVVAVMDGDGQMDPEILDDIVEPVVRDEADYVVGDRLGGRDSWNGMPPFRLFGNLVLTQLTRIASGYWSLSDPQNGYTAISRGALETIDIDALYDDYGFLNDLLVRLNVHGFEIANVPMNARYGDEESDIRYSSFIPKLSVLLCRLFVWRVGTAVGTGTPTSDGERVSPGPRGIVVPLADEDEEVSPEPGTGRGGR